MLSTPLLNEIIDVAFAPPWLRPSHPPNKMLRSTLCLLYAFGGGRADCQVRGWSDQIVRKLEPQIALFRKGISLRVKSELKNM
ncbi:hypothetical protein TNIN_20251 [Trichonephila inaurata madagascariensis]|uniref:Uncharacterized protein n=1 Tax=Trichonephila inaurata madagascariensis TaxID=2747483 RepID=A0A8X7BRS6_9ARAC|nr:hypothetical protein TNIN_20251 [Trichonephila inaurata madagascariensis]